MYCPFFSFKLLLCWKLYNWISSKGKKFRNYDLEGTFTDNYGNIGIFNAVVISDVESGKLIKLDSTGENIYSNNEKIYFRGVREKKRCWCRYSL